MSIIFGKDYPDKIILYVYFIFINNEQYDITNMSEFPRDFSNLKYIDGLYVEQFYKEETRMQGIIQDKKDDYVFKDTIDDFKKAAL